MTDTSASQALPYSRRAISFFERLVVRIGRAMLPDSLAGSIEIRLPTGRTLRVYGDRTGPQAVLTVHSWRVLQRAIHSGAIGFADSYVQGEVDSPDLTSLIRFFARNKKLLRHAGGRLFAARSTERIRHRRRANTRQGSKRNIAAHYDLSNEFFSRWLDETMTYSAACFTNGSETLAQAQANKYDKVLKALNLPDTASILEIGCGWGGFAAHTLPGKDHIYSGITLSKEQLQYARQRPELVRRASNWQFRLEDYRDTQGMYDAIVSIEMIEAVGEENWNAYFSVLRERLKPGGQAVIQSIVIEPESFEHYRRRPDFIQRYIFPGGMLPTSDILIERAHRAGLNAEVIELFPQDYARTLRHWREAFEAAWPDIRQLGFDERFRRLWHYYLAYCEGAFAEEVIGVGLYRLSRPGH